IPALHEVGETETRLYMVRRLVEGDDLQNNIGNSTGNKIEVARIIAEIATALDYAHEQGVVHGYVHPRHLLLGNDGGSWLIGFGEYPAPDPAVLGNPIHLAPEQIAGGIVTARSDVYALAETAVWLLSGRHPFRGWRSAELIAAKRRDPLHRDYHQGRPAIP